MNSSKCKKKKKSLIHVHFTVCTEKCAFFCSGSKTRTFLIANFVKIFIIFESICRLNEAFLNVVLNAERNIVSLLVALNIFYSD